MIECFAGITTDWVGLTGYPGPAQTLNYWAVSELICNARFGPYGIQVQSNLTSLLMFFNSYSFQVSQIR